MFKGLFSAKKVTKPDVILAVGAAAAAVWKAFDTIKDYRDQESDENKEITK